MNHFKFLSSDNSINLQTEGFLTFTPTTPHVNNEFCLQFDDEEPFVFARGNNDLTITVSPTSNGNITFNHNGRIFKLFAREAHDD